MGEKREPNERVGFEQLDAAQLGTSPRLQLQTAYNYKEFK
jgi:hypothetical protein